MPAMLRPHLEPCSVEGCPKISHANRLCSTHGMRKRRYGDPEHVPDKVRWRDAGNALIARCRTAEGLEPGECWPWTGAMRPNGYGHKKRHGTNLAHRVVWIEVFGPISSPDIGVLHHCDNPPCVRPSHLFLGTDADNVADMMAKGREARNYGDDHHNIKLSDAQVAEIRDLRRRGLQLKAIAARYGVDPSHVGKICRGQSRTIPGASDRAADQHHAAGLTGAA